MQKLHEASRTSPWQYVAIAVTSVVTALLSTLIVIVFAVSYSALIFFGPLSPGLSTAVWAVIFGTLVQCVVMTIFTSLPPAAAAPNATVTSVLAVICASLTNLVGGALSQDGAIRHALMIVSMATLFTGLGLAALGLPRRGHLLRFLPYPLIGGFVVATGILLIIGGTRLALGSTWTADRLLGTPVPIEMQRMIVAGGYVLALLLARRWLSSSLVMPASFVVVATAVTFLVASGAVSGGVSAWFLPGAPTLQPWNPLVVASSGSIDWALLATIVPHCLAAAIVAIVITVVTISTLEYTRSTAANLDRELTATGLSTIAMSIAGGHVSLVSPTICRVMDEAKITTRLPGLLLGLALAAILWLNIDVTRYVPIPAIAGLLMFVGSTMAFDAVRRPFGQRRWADLAFMAMIALGATRYGFVAALIFGLVSASILFVYNYARIGAVRRHLTRSVFSSQVDREPNAAQLLHQDGDRIRIVWLQGYLFFGSCDSVFETVRKVAETASGKGVFAVILDCQSVTGYDSSAVMSLAKLSNYCAKGGIHLLFCGLSDALHRDLETEGLFKRATTHAEATRSEALARAENLLLAAAREEGGDCKATSFESWIGRELGCEDPADMLSKYFVSRQFAPGDVVYRQNDPSDTIDVIASGSVALTIESPASRPLRIRLQSRFTVIGEIGFFRGAKRSATVRCEEPAVLFTLSHDAFAKMLAEQPQIAASFMTFVIRILGDRVEHNNREVLALT